MNIIKEIEHCIKLDPNICTCVCCRNDFIIWTAQTKKGSKEMWATCKSCYNKIKIAKSDKTK